MQMVVLEGVTLVKPLADGRDYCAGEIIDLQEAVAQDWQRRGWVVPVAPPRAPVTEPVVRLDYARRLKGDHAR